MKDIKNASTNIEASFKEDFNSEGRRLCTFMNTKYRKTETLNAYFYLKLNLSIFIGTAKIAAYMSINYDFTCIMQVQEKQTACITKR